MTTVVELSRSPAVSRLAILAALAAGLAGCSSDFSRTAESPWSSQPQQSSQQEVTGSVSQPYQQAAPSHRVESSALAAPSAAASAPTYGGSAGIGYQPQQQQHRPEYTGSVSAPPRQATPSQNWNWDGGSAVVVAQGETIDIIARRHRVPAAAIMQANNMTHPAQLQPGQRLVIPKVHQTQQSVQAPQPMAAPAPARVAGPAMPASNNTHVVAPGETIYSLGRHYRVPPMAIAKANNVGLDHRVKIDDRVIIPGMSSGAPRLAAPAQPPVQQPIQQPAPRIAAAPAPKVETTPVATAKPKATQTVAQNGAPTANLVSPAADPMPESAPTGTTGGSSVSFRWPVKGRIADGFGPKAAGGQNDGINISVPHGTPIKAAEDGVVAYAGSELKGYGNLVLVRHSNGFVTAYAHASELGVKKGETVKRGQVIGKAGQTGNVTSPQVHFEVRKGATPVDPTQYLTGG